MDQFHYTWAACQAISVRAAAYPANPSAAALPTLSALQLPGILLPWLTEERITGWNGSSAFGITSVWYH